MNKTKNDWGCLQWFILAFLLLAVVLTLIIMVSSPSGGRSKCQGALFNKGVAPVNQVSNSYRVSPFRGDHRPFASSNYLVKTIVAGSTGHLWSGESDVHHTDLVVSLSSSPGTVAQATSRPKPKSKDAPRKPTKGPSGASGGIKLDLDSDECD